VDDNAPTPRTDLSLPSWTRAGVPAVSWLDRRRAILVLVALVIAIGFGLSVGPEGAIAPTSSANGYGDADLYRELAARVSAGEPYYPAAVFLQQLHGYPTMPFVVVRPPTLTLLRVALGDGLSTALLVALGAAGILALGRQISRAGASRVEWFGAVLLLGVNAALWATVAFIVPLALFGWLFAGRLGQLVLSTCGLFIAGFLVVGRSNNTYWGLLFAAVLVAGLAFAPRGLLTTVRVALGKPAGPRTEQA
jgi:hypothetical protein